MKAKEETTMIHARPVIAMMVFTAVLGIVVTYAALNL